MYRETYVIWAGCWCRAPSVYGSVTREVPLAWKSLLASNRCRDTFSCTRELCCSVSAGRNMETAVIRHPRTASSTVSRYGDVCICYINAADTILIYPDMPPSTRFIINSTLVVNNHSVMHQFYRRCLLRVYSFKSMSADAAQCSEL